MIFPLNPTIRRDDRLNDDEFYAFCQANPSLRIEREADGRMNSTPYPLTWKSTSEMVFGWVGN